MKIAINRRSLRRILQWTQRCLSAGAVALLAYAGFVLADAWHFQDAERRQLERLLTDRRESPKDSPPVAAAGLVGRIDIARLGLSAIVVEGAGAIILRRAAGHIPATAFPGQKGNVGLSGHRDTFFRPLRNIRRNDVITLTTLLGEYRYHVVSTKIVRPRDVEVLYPSESEILTLVTCFPFYFVGSAPNRFIVRAERVI
jgi:sortase A